ncbi:T6SS immunity protein Tdi1 domain-containing protein [Treponema sp.]
MLLEIGSLMYDECFVFVPLLSLGGSEKNENLLFRYINVL